MKTKIAIKNQDITPYGGIFYVEKDNRTLQTI